MEISLYVYPSVSVATVADGKTQVLWARGDPAGERNQATNQVRSAAESKKPNLRGTVLRRGARLPSHGRSGDYSSARRLCSDGGGRSRGFDGRAAGAPVLKATPPSLPGVEAFQQQTSVSVSLSGAELCRRHLVCWNRPAVAQSKKPLKS